MAAATTATKEDDQIASRRAFDGTKSGVKVLLETGTLKIPSFFHHPKPKFIPPPPPPHISVPTIDLSLPRAAVLPAVLSAARTWGFFQLTNHPIPLPVLANALSAVRSFHELPPSVRSLYYARGGANGGVSYVSNVDLYSSAAASWRDTLQIMTGPRAPDEGKVPAVCREEIREWDAAARGLAGEIMGMLAEGMGLEEGRLEEMSCLDGRVLACHYYPVCPEPDVTAGLVDHSDPGVLTILLQDQIGGLQVKKEGEDGEWWWVDVAPVAGAVVVNVGDLLQVLSSSC